MLRMSYRVYADLATFLLRRTGRRKNGQEFNCLIKGEHKAKVVLEQQGMEGMHF